MEWLIGLFVLWLIGTLSGTTNSTSSTSQKRLEDDRASKERLAEIEERKKKFAELEAGKKKFAELELRLKSLGVVLEEKAEKKPFVEAIRPIAKLDELDKIVESLDEVSDVAPIKNINKSISLFNDYGVTSFWHMTHRDNIEKILNHGILSNIVAYSQQSPKDISDNNVQKWRDNKEPIYDRAIHEYAPMYINIRNPMLYVRKDIKDELCLIEISLSVLSENNFIFTDGNAASKSTVFFNNLDDLNQLPWNVLNAEYWSSFEDGKRKRCAEVLVYPSIESRYIKRIHCNSYTTLQFLKSLNCNAVITQKLFF